MYDEAKVSAMVGLVSGLGLLLGGAYPAVLSGWDFWVWGIALPITLAGVFVHYLPRLRRSFFAYAQRADQFRFCP